MAQYTPGRLTFKDSPFYTILEPLTPVVECKGVNSFPRGRVVLMRMLKRVKYANTLETAWSSKLFLLQQLLQGSKVTRIFG